MISTFSLHSYKLNKLSQPVDQFSEKEKKISAYKMKLLGWKLSPVVFYR